MNQPKNLKTYQMALKQRQAAEENHLTQRFQQAWEVAQQAATLINPTGRSILMRAIYLIELLVGQLQPTMEQVSQELLAFANLLEQIATIHD